MVGSEGRRSRPVRASGAAGATLVLVGVLASCGGSAEDPVTIGLITKQEANPYWVTMREVAEDAAAERGAELLTATGTSDVDVESQVAALRDMTERGADGILIAPTDSSGLAPAIEEARAAGVTVIAVDTPVEPASAVDGVFATDNAEAGRLVGRYAAARAERDGLEPRIVLLDLSPGIASGELRRAGFLEGFGVTEDDPAVVASVETQGDRERARDGMAQVLAESPDVTVVYAVNEPAARGAVEALDDAGVAMADVVVVAVDGGCAAMKSAVRPGDIDATAQQYPQNMAREGVAALVDAARDGTAPAGALDTGVQLITGTPVPGVASRDVPYGVRNCWGG